MLAVAVLVGISGCAPALRSESSRSVQCPAAQVFLRGPSTDYPFRKIGILPTAAPAYAEPAAKVVNSIYHDALLQSGDFLRVIRISDPGCGGQDGLWWARQSHCDLLMSSRILLLWYGSGYLPTRLEVRIRIIDVRTGDVLWNLRQRAFSEPGPVVDLGWTTFDGQPARAYPALVQRLAVQLAGLLAAPPTKGSLRRVNGLRTYPRTSSIDGFSDRP